MEIPWSSDAVEKYKFYMGIGSGSTTVWLEVFKGERIEIGYYYHWMTGSGHPKRWKIYGTRWQLTGHYGALKIYSFEFLGEPSTNMEVKQIFKEMYSWSKTYQNSISEDDFDEPPPFYGKDFIMFEYILLPESAPQLPDDDVLAEIGAMGYADWNITFDLVLLLHESAEWITGKENKDKELHEVIGWLRHAKFQRIT